MTAQLLHGAIYCAVFLCILTVAGNRACQLMMNLVGLKDALANAGSSAPGAGRYIGAIERMIIAIGVIAHGWEAIAAIVALKAIGRFKELDEQLPAEYFILGTLFSILWAIAVTVMWMLYDKYVGAGLANAIAHILI